MKAVEFKSKIKNNKIEIPAGIEDKLDFFQNKQIRVIVLTEDTESNEVSTFKNKATAEFFDGYSETDAVYDDFKQ